MNRLLILLIGFIASVSSYAQVNRYAVFFDNKSGEDYPYSLERPTEFLSDKAIERRSNQNLTLDESDLPVHPKYVDSLRSLNIDLYFTTRWMNAAIVQIEDSLTSVLESLNFVDSVALIAEGEKLTREKIALESPIEFKDPGSVSASTHIQLAMLQADVMHRKEIDGSGMLIAIFDNGFKGVDKYKPFEHLWANNQIIAHKDFVENSGSVYNYGDHGTSVFSTIGAKYDDYFTGTAYGADFVLCRTEENGSEDRIEEFNWLLGAEFADSIGVDIINASLGYRMFDIPEHNYDYDDLDGNTTIVSQAAKMASDKGMLVVISAGNQGDNPPNKWRYVTPPADVADALTVGSVNPDFTWTAFSSIGPTNDGRVKPDVAALGLGTTIIKGNGNITRGNGTSYSAPQMAGFAAGVWQTNRSLTNLEVIAAIKSAGNNALNPDSLIGNGVPFYSYIESGKVIDLADVFDEKVYFYPNPFDDEKLSIKTEKGLNGRLEVEIADEEGNIFFEKTIRLSKSQTLYEIKIDQVQEELYVLSLQYENQKKAVKLINF